MFETVSGFANLLFGLVKGMLPFISGPSLWATVDIGSVSRKIESGTKIRELEINLQMVNERPDRPIRIEGVTLTLPQLRTKKVVQSFEGRLGNRHWQQSWPLHLGIEKAILRIGFDLSDIDQIPKALEVRVVIKAPKGLRREKVIKQSLPIQGGV